MMIGGKTLWTCILQAMSDSVSWAIVIISLFQAVLPPIWCFSFPQSDVFTLYLDLFAKWRIFFFNWIHQSSNKLSGGGYDLWKETRWIETLVIFPPLRCYFPPLRRCSNLTHIFQTGWFNHELKKTSGLFLWTFFGCWHGGTHEGNGLLPPSRPPPGRVPRCRSGTEEGWGGATIQKLGANPFWVGKFVHGSRWSPYSVVINGVFKGAPLNGPK